MTKLYKSLIVVLLYGILAIDAFAQEEAVLMPIKDNTLFEDSGELSNGAGDFLFAGRTGTNSGPFNRRALLAFDLTGELPENARVDSVFLRLNVSRVPNHINAPDQVDMTLHRVTRDWGEGTSDANFEEGSGADASTDDATWTYAFFDTEEWDNDGGDFNAEASGSFTVGGTGTYTVESTEEMVADVQAWHDDPSSNFGWIIIGDESQMHTARRFDSRDFGNPAREPQLTIHYTETTARERDDLPRTLILRGNYPNPFEGSTTIRYELDKADEISLRVFDLTGRVVMERDRGLQLAGSHALTVSAQSLAAGSYIYCLEGQASRRDCRPMVVLP